MPEPNKKGEGREKGGKERKRDEEATKPSWLHLVTSLFVPLSWVSWLVSSSLAALLAPWPFFFVHSCRFGYDSGHGVVWLDSLNVGRARCGWSRQCGQRVGSAPFFLGFGCLAERVLAGVVFTMFLLPWVVGSRSSLVKLTLQVLVLWAENQVSYIAIHQVANMSPAHHLMHTTGASLCFPPFRCGRAGLGLGLSLPAWRG